MKIFKTLIEVSLPYCKALYVQKEIIYYPEMASEHRLHESVGFLVPLFTEINQKNGFATR